MVRLSITDLTDAERRELSELEGSHRSFFGLGPTDSERRRMWIALKSFERELGRFFRFPQIVEWLNR